MATAARPAPGRTIHLPREGVVAAPVAEEVEMNAVTLDRPLAAAPGRDCPRADLPAGLPEAAAEATDRPEAVAEAAIVAKSCRRRMSATSAIR